MKYRQTGSTTYGNTHGIRIHTTGLAGEKLTVQVYKENAPATLDGTYKAADKTFVVAELAQEFADQTVPENGTLDIDFPLKAEWKDGHPETESFKSFVLEVLKNIKDAQANEQLTLIASQYATNDGLPLAIMRPPKQIGIKLLDDKLPITNEDLKSYKTQYLVVTNNLFVTRQGQQPLQPQSSPTVVHFEDIEVEDREECPRCKKLTDGELAAVFPSSTADTRVSIIKAFNNYAPKFHLDTCLRKAHFFAQAKQESGDGLTAALNGESMNYSEHGLLNTGFGNVSKRPDGHQLAHDLGRPDKYSNGQRTYKAPDLTLEQQIKVANFIYGLDPKAFDLGNRPPHDNKSLDAGENEGWQFKGRGMTQVTGRSNYKRAQNWIEKILHSKPIDITEGKKGSDKFTGEEAALSGFADWDMDGMWTAADNGCTKAECWSVVDIINRSTKSREKRVANLIGGDWTMDDSHGTVKDADCMKTIFKVAECTKGKGRKKLGDGKWHDPVDHPQLRGWYNKWDPSGSNFGYSDVRGHNHQGFDLIARVGSMLMLVYAAR